jgi:hypothetical protein
MFCAVSGGDEVRDISVILRPSYVYPPIILRLSCDCFSFITCFLLMNLIGEGLVVKLAVWKKHPFQLSVALIQELLCSQKLSLLRVLTP